MVDVDVFGLFMGELEFFLHVLQSEMIYQSEKELKFNTLEEYADLRGVGDYCIFNYMTAHAAMTMPYDDLFDCGRWGMSMLRVK